MQWRVQRSARDARCFGFSPLRAQVLFYELATNEIAMDDPETPRRLYADVALRYNISKVVAAADAALGLWQSYNGTRATSNRPLYATCCVENARARRYTVQECYEEAEESGCMGRVYAARTEFLGR
jgi:hypothetical protein